MFAALLTSSVLQGIYPVVVVILVHSQKSYVEDSGTGASARSDLGIMSGSGSRPFWGNSRRSVPKVIQVHQTHAVELDTLDCAEPPRKRTLGTVSEGTGSITDLRLSPDLKDHSEKRLAPDAVV